MLERLGAPTAQVEEINAIIQNVMRLGPEPLEPLLLLDGVPELSIRDREAGEILATTFAARARVLVTDNLDDFKADLNLSNSEVSGGLGGRGNPSH